uniref:Uncharacterized protein n=1 Tax=Kuenenia stuttgartiensis TaxID=174633 RepID=Q1Q580_KUEST|nr:unknown protein [Candidatus Kuenenia stuttgartiensis]
MLLCRHIKDFPSHYPPKPYISSVHLPYSPIVAKVRRRRCTTSDKSLGSHHSRQPGTWNIGHFPYIPPDQARNMGSVLYFIFSLYFPKQ